MPKTFVHHPETPAIMLDSQLGKSFPNGPIVPGMTFVVIHRTVGVKELAGLPNADLVLLVHITDQFSFLSRPYSFFSITSLSTVMCSVCSATIFLYWLSSVSNSFIRLT